MRSVLVFFVVFCVLVVTGAVLDHHKDLTVLVFAWAASFFLWVVLGALFAARAVLRFLRR